MKKLKLTLLTTFMIFPLAVFAHGEEVLSTLYAEVTSIIIFLTAIILIRMKLFRKFLLVVVYVISSAYVFYRANNMAYLDNASKINLLIACGPLACTFLVYLLLKAQRKLSRRYSRSNII